MNSASNPSSPLALVTGAAGIIGPAIVEDLLSKGWRVVATDRSQTCFDLLEKVLGKSLPAEVYTADLGSQAACQELICRVESLHGGLSAIVNGAAYNPGQPVTAITEEAIRDLFAVNFSAPLFLAQAALPSLKRNQGAVVNLSSILVAETRKNNLLYASSKAALEVTAGVMALEFMREGVRFNNIRIGRVPGYAFLRKVLPTLPDELAQKMVRDINARRLEAMEAELGKAAVGRPEDIAQMVSFLLSPAARFLNGQTFVANGGYVSHSPGGGDRSHFTGLIEQWLAENAPAANV